MKQKHFRVCINWRQLLYEPGCEKTKTQIKDRFSHNEEAHMVMKVSFFPFLFTGGAKVLIWFSVVILFCFC